MPRFERGDIVKIKDSTAGLCVVESYIEPDSGPASVRIMYDKIIVQFMGRDLDRVELIRESSFDNYYNLQSKKRGQK